MHCLIVIVGKPLFVVRHDGETALQLLKLVPLVVGGRALCKLGILVRLGTILLGGEHSRVPFRGVAMKGDHHEPYCRCS